MEESKPFSVGEITKVIKGLISGSPDLKNVWVRGEISNYSRPNSGHIYFSLKDETSLIRCTFFNYSNKNYTGKPLSDGKEIQVYGSVTLYEAGGSYNLNVSKVEELGQGDILLRIERLKQKLTAEGIFDPEKKRRIPSFPKTLGIATSPSGAAIEDIIKIARSRYPGINILIAPCVVQGEDAPASITAAIEELNRPEWNVDVIIAGRGGGSFEDLMAYNDESVVRAYANSKVPIISAVGHQTDVLLTDFAADFATPTPTAAAEHAVPKEEDILQFLSQLEGRLRTSLSARVSSSKDRLRLVSGKFIFREPMQLLNQRSQRLDEIGTRLQKAVSNKLNLALVRLERYETLSSKIHNILNYKKQKAEFWLSKVEDLSPVATMKRGYSIVRNQKGEIIRSPKETEPEEELQVLLSGGTIQVVRKGN
ncbi:exodeoxyribonuclease VII large subunit [Leptospira gomenensis]|uniref:Exodeoxyribonuclease 7 large subunit n=1 Tax=Leptospira gomenensis TaxID=2484974 RepID=A0A5F1YN42_9LEPT|nr:exodeoxyribonuclease VII large subunit [Leptospira gomenensis]TGK35007.1 exodeoxyribonuclease VII large subunit [Leptospira gomenensis]TGK35315.1 exodeoxyribonuclease VII large subunit [Leptospira gomenensis]TGK51800.1 exodeoxyribonuclease VII large subunit [Leptospira gomenensis]TGK58395.1 exodeoxyribonuclease VII large subunit [Leptospira gomenensis]